MLRHINQILVILAVAATFAMFATSAEPVIPVLRGTIVERPLQALGWPNAIVFNLSIGYLITVFFWALVVYLPDKKRRLMLRGYLTERYQRFKEEVIQTLLWASIGGHDSKLPRELSDHVKFKAFFDKDGKANWFAAVNGLQGDKMRMSELIHSLQTFSDEIAYALRVLPIQDESVHNTFKILNDIVGRQRAMQPNEYDSVKSVTGFVWLVLSRWNFVDGQREDDAFQKMIDRL